MEAETGVDYLRQPVWGGNTSEGSNGHHTQRTERQRKQPVPIKNLGTEKQQKNEQSNRNSGGKGRLMEHNLPCESPPGAPQQSEKSRGLFDQTVVPFPLVSHCLDARSRERVHIVLSVFGETAHNSASAAVERVSTISRLRGGVY